MDIADKQLGEKIVRLLAAARAVTEHFEATKRQPATDPIGKPKLALVPAEPAMVAREGRKRAKRAKRGRPVNPNSRWQRALSLLRAGVEVDDVVKVTGLTRSAVYCARSTLKSV